MELNLAECEQLASQCNLTILDSVFRSKIPFASADLATLQKSIIIMEELTAKLSLSLEEFKVAHDSQEEVEEQPIYSQEEVNIAIGHDNEEQPTHDSQEEVDESHLEARDIDSEELKEVNESQLQEAASYSKIEIEQLLVYKESLIQYDCQDQLYIVHPSLARKIITKLGELIPMDTSHDEGAIEVINGYKFEWDLVQECGKRKILSIAYSFDGGKVTTKDLTVDRTVFNDVALRVTPTLGTLYLLRNMHPVIDAIGVLASTKEKFLILMQVLLKSYSSHSKKSENLYDTIRSPECPISRRKSILAYYKGLCSEHKIEDDHIIYVYASPKECHSNPQNIAVRGVAVAKRKEKFAVATIPEDSVSGGIIKKIVRN